MYLIMKDNYYVSLSGRKHSYTTKLKYAQTFVTYDKALKNKCGNEHIVKLEDEMLNQLREIINHV